MINNTRNDSFNSDISDFGYWFCNHVDNDISNSLSANNIYYCPSPGSVSVNSRFDHAESAPSVVSPETYPISVSIPESPYSYIGTPKTQDYWCLTPDYPPSVSSVAGSDISTVSLPERLATPDACVPDNRYLVRSPSPRTTKRSSSSSSSSFSSSKTFVARNKITTTPPNSALDSPVITKTCHLTDYSDISNIDSNIDSSQLYPEVKNAYEECQKRNSILPLTKLQLRFKLQEKRCKLGIIDNAEIEKPKITTEKLSPEDLERQRKRREANKLAAQKYRKSKVDKQQADDATISTLAKENQRLRNQIQDIINERDAILNLTPHLRSYQTYLPHLFTETTVPVFVLPDK